MAKNLTVDIARHLLSYDPETGLLTRKYSPREWQIGKVLGTPNAKGYLIAWVHDGPYLVHRLIWLLVHGRWPTEQIDHINRVRDDNRLVNLRECTNAENRQNIKPEGYGVSGHLGVHPHPYGWAAEITLAGKSTRIGVFDDPETASAAYLAAKKKLHIFVYGGERESVIDYLK